ncbi:alpha-E domain-containing protein [Burkholderiaceae bacterium UC74_6]
MLSRTADHLFWQSRYMERAENTARILDVNYQASLLPQTPEVAEAGWRSVLSIFELLPAYTAKYGEIEAERVQAFIVSDENNPSSIVSSLRAARENARAVRGALTTEVWEATNQTWLEFRRHLKDGTLARDPAALFEWVKLRAHLARGVTLGTMLQDEALDFLRIGSYLERADNTARMLDVKFHAVKGEPREETAAPRDPAAEFYHWSSVLRSVSAFEVYRKVYSSVIVPEKVAELLILQEGMPRSLAHCMGRVQHSLQRVANAQSGETLRQAGKLKAELDYGRINEILATGLHAYLIQFLERVGDLGADISRDFLIPS